MISAIVLFGSENSKAYKVYLFHRGGVYFQKNIINNFKCVLQLRGSCVLIIKNKNIEYNKTYCNCQIDMSLIDTVSIKSQAQTIIYSCNIAMNYILQITYLSTFFH